MTQKEEKMPEDEYAVLQTKFLMIMVAISITSAIGVFSSSAFLFTNPGVISGIVFALCLIFLVIVPIILLAIYYNKKMKPLKVEEEKRIITLTKSSKSKGSRLEFLE